MFTKMQLTDRNRQGGPSRLGVAVGGHLLVVVSARAARVYAYELRGQVPQQLIPYDRSGFGRHLHWAEDRDGAPRGGRRQDEFAGAVAHTLRGAGTLLLLGSGPGARATVNELFNMLRHRYQDLADRVLGSIVVAEGHLTEDQLRAAACEFHAGSSVRARGPSHHTEPRNPNGEGHARES